MLGNAPMALGVIPSCAQTSMEQFREALESFRNQGHELLLHGFQHQADVRLSRSWGGRIALHLTHGEAEFAGLDELSSRSVLEDALRAWEMLAVGPADGFVPPTWHAPEYLAEQVLAMGWPCFESRWGIWTRKNVRCQHIFSAPVSLAGLPEPLPRLALGLAAQVFSLWGVPRLVLHPGELTGPHGQRIVALLEKWQAHGQQTTYRALEKKLNLSHD